MAVIDLADEFGRRHTPYVHAVARAIGFELASALTYEHEDLDQERLVRKQHDQNGDLLAGLINPSRN
jgi:hypothetical protein